jgi:hypothetical protein
VTEQGFLQSAPGASTKLSSALALFRCCRVLAKVLEENYPTSASYELSLSKTAALDAELEAWQETLAPHLRMEFVQDKPSTNVVSSRSPLLVCASLCTPRMKVLTIPGSYLSLHPYPYPQTCCLRSSRREGFCFCCRSSLFQQANCSTDAAIG